jgi:hypothetical protein
MLALRKKVVISFYIPTTNQFQGFVSASVSCNQALFSLLLLKLSFYL